MSVEIATVERVETPAIDRDGLRAIQAAGKPLPLEAWMALLYTRVCDERTLTGDLGVWPEELGPYLTNLCRAYTPDGTDEAPVEPARFTLKPGLLARYGDIGHYPPLEPLDPEQPTLVLILSGGKDSIAAGIRAQMLGYSVHAFHATKVNHSYPHEEGAVVTICQAMGWPLTIITPTHVPKSLGNNVVKNQYVIACAAEILARRGVAPAAFACGNFLVEDCYTTSWYGDMQTAFRSFNVALAGAYAETYSYVAPTCVTLLDDVLHSVRVWWKHAPAEVKAVTASCMMPPRNKVQHRRRCLTNGIPLISEHDCGYCEKCKLRAVLLVDRIGITADEIDYPADYLKKARKWLRGAVRGSTWCHTHPALEVTADDLQAAMTRAVGERESARLWREGLVTWSQAYTAEIVFGGVLGSAGPHGQYPAHEPIIQYATQATSAPTAQEAQPMPDVKPRKRTKTPEPSETIPTPGIRDRIKGLRWVKASELVPNPENWREHPDEQRALFREVLDRVGFAGAELTVKLPDGRLMLVDGHMRQEEMGDQPIPCLETDLTLEEARLILASYDPVAQLASVNAQKAAALVQSISAQSGHVGMVLQRMAERQEEIRALMLGLGPTPPPLMDPNDLGWGDFDGVSADDDEEESGPKLRAPAGGEIGERYGVLAECANESEQRRVYDLLTREGITCRVLTL